MNAAQLTLAQHLATHANFEWKDGMLRNSKASLDKPWLAERLDHVSAQERPSPHSNKLYPGVPDLTDDATAGILLAMLPRHKGRLWIDGELSLLLSGEGTINRWSRCFCGDTLGEACAQALIASWP